MDTTQTTNSKRGTSALSIIFGIIMVVMGLVALIFMGIDTASSIMLLGWLLTIGGILQIVFAFTPEQRSHMFIGLFVGLMYLLVGLALLSNPTALMGSLAVYMSLFFGVNGIYKIVIALIDRFHNWGWVALNGAVSFLFALYLWYMSAIISLPLISGFIGMELLLWGVSFFFVPFASMEAMHHDMGTMHHEGGSARQ